VGDETGAINRYRRNPNVLYAERNVIRTIPKLIANRRTATHTPGSEIVPGDHFFNEQWALHNTGQLFYCIIPTLPDFCLYIGTPDADIDAPEAWAISAGSTVMVAVIDTGIDYTHPDLIQAYAGGLNYVSTAPDGTPTTDPLDDHGHGTHVSGTIAAALNNVTGDPAEEEGVVGVAPHARIRAYKVCDANGSCNDFSVQQAIVQAASDGAKVINMSLGGPENSQALNDAVQFAWNRGVVIVAGAGNDGDTGLFYPAALENVISVAAFDEDHRRPPFSNYGNWVDISAPGNQIMSTYPMSSCAATATPGDFGCYTWLTGTSMATPHVSGAAALVWSRPDVFTNQQVVDIILNSADPVGRDAVRLDSWTIHGGLYLHDAMSFGSTAVNVPPIADAGPDRTVTDGNADGTEVITLNGSASSDPDGSIVSYAWREGSTLLASVASPTLSFAVGTHTLALQVTDNLGATATDTMVVTVIRNQPPVANAGPDRTVNDANNDRIESVTLSALESSDADGTIVGYVWREGSTVLASGIAPTIAFAVGTHTVTLDVTDNLGATGTDTVVVTVMPFVAPATMHVGDLDQSTLVNKNTWSARVTVTVHNATHQPLAGAVVTGSWSGGASGSGTCTSATNGTCVIASNSIRKRDASATLTVTSITASGLSYSVGQNHDPDGDSTGTAITIARP
jgi:subtilisin family serine protease